MNNIESRGFPYQKVPLSKKTRTWKEASVNAIISKFGTGHSDKYQRIERIDLLEDLYDGIFDEKDLKYVTDPYKVMDQFPASLQNLNIIRSKVDLLIGEESKRPFNYLVTQTSDDVITAYQSKSKELLFEYIQMENDDESQTMLESIQTYLTTSFKSDVEEIAYRSLDYLKEKLNIQNEFIRGFGDLLKVGEEIYYIGILNGNPYLERCALSDCDFDKDPNLEFIEDGDWFTRKFRQTPSAIYDRFYDQVDEKTLDKILAEFDDQYNGKVNTGSDVNTKTVIYKDAVSDPYFNNTDMRSNTIELYHTVWRSFKRVGFLKIIDEETGEETETIVNEGYDADPGENIEWKWMNEIWEGYRVGEDIYFGIKPLEYQYNSSDNPNDVKLPYTGTRQECKSLVEVMKPLQYMYIIIWYRLELAIARDKGKIINMDITQIPKSMGIDVNRWMHMISALGVNLINPYETGWDIPGREGGKPSQFNQMSSQDLTMSNVIAQYIGLMTKVEELIGELTGITKQRQGSISTYELVGNVQTSVIQSSNVTEPLFWKHNQVKKRALNLLLNAAKAAWKLSDKKHLNFVLPDYSRVLLKITDDFLYSDFDIFVTDSTKENVNLEAIKSLLQPAIQNGATLLDAASILTSDNITEIKKKLQEVEARKEEREKAIAEQEQQMAQMQMQTQMEITAEENRIKEEDSVRKAQTQIEVALINAESKENNEAPVEEEDDSFIEEKKVELTEQKIQDDYSLKKRQLDETIRKNKVSEKQKQQEIAIKSRQSTMKNKQK